MTLFKEPICWERADNYIRKVAHSNPLTLFLSGNYKSTNYNVLGTTWFWGQLGFGDNLVLATTWFWGQLICIYYFR